MRIVQMAVEFAPIAKVGGLGDVMVGLSRELTRQGNHVEVLLPKYDFLDPRKLSHLKLEVADFKCLENGSLHANAMWSASVEECSLHLLEARHPAGYFHRGKIYNCDDDAARFLYFSRACLEYLKLKNEPIDILHLHDWHVAAAAVMAKEIFKLPIKAILLTIHNAEYQGPCTPRDLDAIGLKGDSLLVKEKLQDDDPEHPRRINLLKGGIVYSDWVNAVSPSYAKEILTSEMGAHLDATLRKYKSKVSGILNGIDSKLWNPENDPHLPKPYNAESSIAAILDAKAKARESIQKQFRMGANHRPWVGAITRLVPQKGPELLEEAARQTLDLGGTFFLLGSSPHLKLQEHFEKIKRDLETKGQAHFHFEYDEALSHLAYAALDFLIVPSIYEPCGLTQMIAMRYGTIPIVRSTGGLRDTVFDCENPAIPVKQRNGFVFQMPKPDAAAEVLKRAAHLFRTDPATFQTMVKRVMGQDFSWKKPAQEYLKLFNMLTGSKNGSMPSRALS